MSEIWTRVRSLEGRTLLTSTGKPFLVVEVGSDYLRIAPESTGKGRPIKRSEIEGAAELKDPTPTEVRAAGISEYNPAYVAAIVRALSSSA